MFKFSGEYGEYGFFSPNSEQYFEIGGHFFLSITHYLEYTKAETFGDQIKKQQIWVADTPGKCRCLGREIKDYNPILWKGKIGAVLYKGLKALYEDNPEYVTKLIETGDEILVYCDYYDDVLGIKMGSSDPGADDMQQWKGQNLLGFTLMEIRSEYRKKMPEAFRERKSNLYSSIGDDYGNLGFDPYVGDEPYIYLNYSIQNIDEAKWLGRILVEAGFNVRYDDQLPSGRLWTGRRSRAVEKSRMVVTLYTGDEKESHIEYLASEFAELLDIPCLIVETILKYRDDGENFIYWKSGDKEFPDRLKTALNKIMEKASEETEKDKKKNGPYDLAVRYYDSYGKKHGMFSYPYSYQCNLRTREVFDREGNRVRDITSYKTYEGEIKEDHGELFNNDEKTYRCILWLRKELVIVPLSNEKEYIGKPEDWEFAERLSELTSYPDEKIAAEYGEAKKRIEDAKDNYPYMDEFEYIDSQFDD